MDPRANMPTPNSKGSYSIISLGCPKNLVDSESMVGMLQLDGYEFLPEPEGVDFVIVNTCGFLHVARQESLDTIREMIRLKKKGLVRGVIVAGCLAERNREALLEQCPGVDQVVGLFGRDEIARAAERLVGGVTEQRTLFRPAPVTALVDRHRLRLTPRHVAYLKVSEGCSRLCTFCSIPNIRGKHVSKPLDQVIAEAEQLVADGARELVLVAQDTTSYGIDLEGEPQLAALLKRLVGIRGLEWVRLMYLYPMHFTDELFDVLSGTPKILPYMDLPLQHISDKILRRMNRRVERAETERLVDQIRQRIDGVVLRTTMITGFPGETDQQFEELLEFVRQRRFERLGVFCYSKEPDTPAARLADHVAPKVARARRDRLMAAQQQIAFAWSESQIGRTLEILIDRCIPGEEDAYVGRSYADAPEVDGAVYVTGRDLTPGQLVPCEIVATREYDLVAVAVGDPR